MDEKHMNDWDKTVEFHGHACPGLAIGAKVCQAVIEKMNVDRSGDEEILCISENDACGVDAIQAILGCSIGKGNLIIGNTGKHVYNFFNRNTGESLRIYYNRKKRDEMTREEKIQDILDSPLDALFIFGETTVEPPAPAKIFDTITCEKCAEGAPEHKIRLENGKKLCLDCFEVYDRI